MTDLDFHRQTEPFKGDYRLSGPILQSKSVPGMFVLNIT